MEEESRIHAYVSFFLIAHNCLARNSIEVYPLHMVYINLYDHFVYRVLSCYNYFTALHKELSEESSRQTPLSFFRQNA